MQADTWTKEGRNYLLLAELQAELATAQRILAEIPEDQPIDRMGWAGRVESITEDIARLSS